MIRFLNKNSTKNAKTDSNHIKMREKWLKFTVHPVTIVFFFVSIFVGAFWIAISYLISLLIHEFAHAIVASRLGYQCGKITLYPTGALLSGAYDEFTFKDEILVSIAGPLANLAMIVTSVFFWWIFPELYNYLQIFVVANLSLFLFNLLPIFPLDGGRVLLAFLSCKLQRKNAIKISMHITIVFSILLFAYFCTSLFFAPNFQIGITSLVVFISSFADSKELAYKRVIKSDLKRKKLKRGLRVVELMVSKQTSVLQAYTKIDNYAYYNFCVVDENFNIIEKFSEKEIENILKENAPNITFENVINHWKKCNFWYKIDVKWYNFAFFIIF